MTNIAPVVPSTVPILPPQPIDTTIYVPGGVLALTTFILGSILMLMMIIFIFMMVFGQPMAVAKKVGTGGGSMIQHFNTSKSASFKDSIIAGGAFRYHNIRDGTVAATVNSVNNIRGRNIVLTFAQLGVTIPIPVLGGISVLVHNGINNIMDLRKKLSYVEVYKDNVINPITNLEEVVEVGRVEKMKNEPIISGYNFDNFETLLKESKEEKLIPLVVEAVPDFVERNISADYTEKKIKIRQLLTTQGETDYSHLKMMTIAVAVCAIFIIGMIVK